MPQILEEDITFIITTFRSEKLIDKCIDRLPFNSKKIIIENSSNYKLKINLEKKYKNLKCFIMENNLGYGAGNNYGIKHSLTRYVFILNPDVEIKSDTIKNMTNELNQKSFAIAAPFSKDEYSSNIFKNKKIIENKYVKGFAMLIDKEEMEEVGYFDENFFLYLEEIDLCIRAKKSNKNIYLINTEVNHLSGISHGDRNDLEMEKSRNWHWMWSTFYFNKKHFGYLYALLKTLPKFTSSIIKLIIYFVLSNKKKEIYMMRVKGLVNSYLLSKAFYRPYKG